MNIFAKARQLFWCGGIEWLHSMDWIGHFESPALANTSSTEAFYSPWHRLMAGNRWYRPSDSRVFNSVDLHFWVHTKLSGKILAKCSKRHVPSSGLLFDLFGSIWHRALRKTQFAVNTITIVSMAVNLWFLHVCLSSSWSLSLLTCCCLCMWLMGRNAEGTSGINAGHGFDLIRLWLYNRWCFEICLIFIPTWGRFPIWHLEKFNQTLDAWFRKKKHDNFWMVRHLLVLFCVL